MAFGNNLISLADLLLVASMPSPTTSAKAVTEWRAQELLLMSEVTRLVGKSLAPEVVLREMLHLISELPGLNRGRIMLADSVGDIALDGLADRKPVQNDSRSPANHPTSSIRYAYGLTKTELARGRYGPGEGITGRVLATAQPIIVHDIDAEPQFLARSVARPQLPQDVVAFIALPIEVNREVIGVLACHRIRSRDRQLNDDVAVLGILATLAGQLLQLQPLVGESGTGKELLARAVHLSSQRRDQPLIKVNCAAIPDTLFGSELFGDERGAFTGVQSARAGWLEQADRGTILLDEIGEMPLAMQTKLLRTLQEGTIVRLRGKRKVKVAVRLVAATNRDLEQDVQRGIFSRDLFYRLNVSLSPDALTQLAQHTWPGNIRKLGRHLRRRRLHRPV